MEYKSPIQNRYLDVLKDRKFSTIKRFFEDKDFQDHVLPKYRKKYYRHYKPVYDLYRKFLDQNLIKNFFPSGQKIVFEISNKNLITKIFKSENEYQKEVEIYRWLEKNKLTCITPKTRFFNGFSLSKKVYSLIEFQENFASIESVYNINDVLAQFYRVAVSNKKIKPSDIDSEDYLSAIFLILKEILDDFELGNVGTDGKTFMILDINSIQIQKLEEFKTLLYKLKTQHE